MVLPDGTILNQLSTLRKDNTGERLIRNSGRWRSNESYIGYDLKQLFIGAEGTLGVVTGVSILTPVMPAATNAVVLALPSFDKVTPLYEIVKRDMGEILSAFEYMDRNAYTISVNHGQGKALSEEETKGAQCFVLVETSGGNRDHDEEVRVFSSRLRGFLITVHRQKLSGLLEKVMDPDTGLVTSGVLAQSPAQFDSLWAIREGIPEAVGKTGKAYKYDVSIPVSKFKEIVDKMKEHLRSKGMLHENAIKEVVSFGHFGDGAATFHPQIPRV